MCSLSSSDIRFLDLNHMKRPMYSFDIICVSLACVPQKKTLNLTNNYLFFQTKLQIYFQLLLNELQYVDYNIIIRTTP